MAPGKKRAKKAWLHMIIFFEDKVISVVSALGGGFPCETPELLCGLGNVSSGSTDIAVSRKWVKT